MRPILKLRINPTYQPELLCSAASDALHASSTSSSKFMILMTHEFGGVEWEGLEAGVGDELNKFASVGYTGSLKCNFTAPFHQPLSNPEANYTHPILTLDVQGSDQGRANNPPAG